LNFLPTATEIAEYAVPHLAHASNPIVSFGQGCEGEPLLSAGLIEESIRTIRLQTRRGSINLNTNGSLPAAVERLCNAGLNSMRVSLNSVQKAFYSAYYRPRGYSFDDVLESIMIAKRFSAWVSLNYLIFPGFTDSSAEVSALRKFLRKTGINMIQTRNLNIDPVWYRDALGIGKMIRKPMGIEQWVNTLRHDFPNVILGYYNPTRKSMRAKLK
jgi:molybdenum cofactor biosynthesis enzyme MoaA